MSCCGPCPHQLVAAGLAIAGDEEHVAVAQHGDGVERLRPSAGVKMLEGGVGALLLPDAVVAEPPIIMRGRARPEAGFPAMGRLQ